MTSTQQQQSKTLNIKGNRRVVRSEYTAESVFKIPDGLDLEDKSVVENWYVWKDKLHIKYVGNEEIESIECDNDHYETFKEPSNSEIEDAEDHPNVEYSDDEDNDEVAEQERIWSALVLQSKQNILDNIHLADGSVAAHKHQIAQTENPCCDDNLDGGCDGCDGGCCDSCCGGEEEEDDDPELICSTCEKQTGRYTDDGFIIRDCDCDEEEHKTCHTCKKEYPAAVGGFWVEGHLCPECFEKEQEPLTPIGLQCPVCLKIYPGEWDKASDGWTTCPFPHDE